MEASFECMRKFYPNFFVQAASLSCYFGRSAPPPRYGGCLSPEQDDKLLTSVPLRVRETHLHQFSPLLTHTFWNCCCSPAMQLLATLSTPVCTSRSESSPRPGILVNCLVMSECRRGNDLRPVSARSIATHACLDNMLARTP